MKKFLPIISGITIGIAISVMMIHFEKKQNADALPFNSWFTDYEIDFEQVFSPSSKGRGIYNLMYKKLLILPKNDTLKDLAQKYGLTVNEAQAAVEGSIAVIYNNSRNNSRNLTQEQAYQIVSNIQEDYAMFKEIHDLEQQLDAATTSSEIFSNGDLLDSGFDLVHDLSLIEKVLFFEESDTYTGGRYEFAAETPPMGDKELAESRYPGIYDENGDDSDDNREDGDSDDGLNDSDDISGDSEFPYLDSDVCEDGSSEEEDTLENPFLSLVSEENMGEVVDKDSFIVNAGGEEEAIDEIKKFKDLFDENGRLKEAPADNWRKSWCPALVSPEQEASAEGAMAVAGVSNLADIGGGSSAAVGAGINAPGVSASAVICVTTELIYNTVSSYNPGQSCIACEVEEINELLNKTLRHSQLPNKVAGNMMESAKCKEAYGTPLIDMKFIMISAPVMTPLNDDVAFGKNIVEEWNKFVNKYKPVLYPEAEVISGFELESVEAYASQEAVMDSIRSQLANEQARAMQELEAYNASDIAGNTAIYTQSLLLEMRQMTAFFESFQNLFEQIDVKACTEIKAKEQK